MADIGGTIWNFQILPTDNLMSFLGGYDDEEDMETFSEELNNDVEENIFEDVDLDQEIDIFGDVDIE